MNRNEEWESFMDGLFECAMKNCRTKREVCFRKRRFEEIDHFLEHNFTCEQKQMVENLLFETGSDDEMESRLIYQQGMRDCVWILKNLGALVAP